MKDQESLEAMKNHSLDQKEAEYIHLYHEKNAEKEQVEIQINSLNKEISELKKEITNIVNQIKDYAIYENEEFILPHLKVEDQHSRYYIGNYSESNILVREVFNAYSIKGWWCEEKSELFIINTGN